MVFTTQPITTNLNIEPNHGAPASREKEVLMTGRDHTYPAALVGSRTQMTYGSGAPYQHHPSPTTSKFKNQAFGLSVIKQTRTMRINETTGLETGGRVTKNLFAQRSQSTDFGIISRLFCAGVVRQKRKSPATLFRVLEDTIICETRRDNTILDIYFSWDGMIGTTADKGQASFNFSIMTAYGETLKMLSHSDAINRLGAQTCNGRSSLRDNHIKDLGTRVTFVIHREIRLGTPAETNAISEIHFESPESNFFKIITR